MRDFKSKFLKLISLKDDPKVLAKSVALGFFLAFLPLPGLNYPLGIILAKFFKLNIIATTLPAVIVTYIGPFFYIVHFKVGALFITSVQPPQNFEYNLAYIINLFKSVTSPSDIWGVIVELISYLGPAFLLGSLIDALLAAMISYCAFLLIYKSTAGFIKRKKSTKIKFRKYRPTGYTARIKNPQVINKFRQNKIYKS